MKAPFQQWPVIAMIVWNPLSDVPAHGMATGDPEGRFSICEIEYPSLHLQKMTPKIFAIALRYLQ